MLPSSFPPAAAATASPARPIPGGYGPPLLGPLRDRLDYFWFQGPEEFFRRRAAAHRSTVFRANIPPAFPFLGGGRIDPRVVAVVDAAAFTALFDPALVDKRDVLIGPYNPGVGFTGGTRVGVYLDTEEAEHERTKAFSIDLLHRGARVWAAEFQAAVDDMLNAVDGELLTKLKENQSNEESEPAVVVGFVAALQRCLFRFLCKALVGADTSADPFVDKNGFLILDAWLALQLTPTQKIGLPQPLEEIFLHSFPLPSFLVSPFYNRLYRFVEEHGAEAVAIGEKEYGLSKKDAINNVLFVLGFNAFGGFSVFLPFLLADIGKPGDPTGLRKRLKQEVRQVLLDAGESSSPSIGFSAVREMPLLRSTVYEVLRMRPPVPLQFGRARKDFVLRSHGDDAFAVNKGDLLCGYQPLAMRDAKVFDRPDEFLPERFLGDQGQQLLQYLYWSNGPQTSQPDTGNKQCAAKDAVVDTACMLIAHMFRRYDDFEVDGISFTKLQKRST
ncbi:hypothetical protein PR202_gb05977 [Eleusine coracana subsp. coracana]|uniref:hydroperoxide dehydratase n=1 Tax=Eleusine coracana subsp. coracana TaxID=191504 RepID=A0AAV5E5W5_ELECO|nr:hypothetical protein QOZ80_2BG0152400 [Eleusine coracana subsp. coracana]GJN18778.1 hypothetical protein PR202_gb05977 [Eleusine coracana subsp. coracana]